MSPISITICLQTTEIHRNCDAPCDYTYIWTFHLSFLDTLGASDSTLHNVTMAAIWHGLETVSSDSLAPCWVVEILEPNSEEKLWMGLWSRAVPRGAFYYPIAVKPSCRRSHRWTQEWQLYTGICPIFSTESSQKMSDLLHEALRMEQQWCGNIQIPFYPQKVHHFSTL